jgi:replication factor C small subunit
VFRFRSLPPAEMQRRLEAIAAAEGKQVDPGAYAAILAASDGDLRRAINLLQLAATYAEHITEATIGECATVPLRSEIEAMLLSAIQGDFSGARTRLFALIADRGASGDDIVRAIHTYLPGLPDAKIAPLEKIRLVEYLAEIDYRLAQGASDRVQLEAVLAKLALGKPAGG